MQCFGLPEQPIGGLVTPLLQQQAGQTHCGKRLAGRTCDRSAVVRLGFLTAMGAAERIAECDLADWACRISGQERPAARDILTGAIVQVPQAPPVRLRPVQAPCVVCQQQRVKQIEVERQRQQGLDQIEAIGVQPQRELQPFACGRIGALLQMLA